MNRILVTGSEGFVGKALVKLLKSYSYEVLQVGGSKIINLNDKKIVEQLPVVDVIVHLAARSFVPDSFRKPSEFYYNNFLSTLNILEKAKKDCSKVIFFSTYVYGSPQYLPIDEAHPKQPLNPYTQSKILCEDLCEAYNRDFNLPIIIFRPFNIYGHGQSDHFFIPTIIKQMEKTTILLNDPRPKRDFIYIDDVVEAIRLALENFKSNFTIYNLGSGISTSINEVVHLIEEILMKKVEVNYSNQVRQGEVLDTIANIDKIKSELNWYPRYSIKLGLERLLSYHKLI
jgi:nucleoside-diphosphate-sugar epimerase